MSFLLVLGHRHLKNYLQRRTLLIVWILINFIIFWFSFENYRTNLKYYYIRKILGIGLCFSRGTATVINFACFMLFLPMCKTCITILKSYCTNYLSTKRKKQSNESKVKKLKNVFKMRWLFLSITSKISSFLDQSQKFHIMSSYTLIIASSIHTIGHLVNAYSSSKYYNNQYKDVNMASFSGQSPFMIIFFSIPGLTGNLLILLLTIIVIASIRMARETNYEVFWFCHRFIILIIILIICHPLGGILKEQVNLDEHYPGCEMMKTNYSLINVPCSKPKFQSLQPSIWKWLLVALIIYCSDILARIIRSWKSLHLIRAKLLGANDILELELAELGCNRSLLKYAKPGQFVYLKCPQISFIQWHPFSLTSIPIKNLNNTFSIHIRVNGDWTNHLKKKIIINSLANNENMKFFSTKPLKLYIDGPFCSPVQDIFSFKISICIAGGIGVTPFASIFSFINSTHESWFKLEKLYFIWLCRDIHSLKCFLRLIHRFWLKSKSEERTFDVKLFLTQESFYSFNQNIKRLTNCEKFIINVLKNNIYFGKPNWATFLFQFQKFYKTQRIAVFCSGPQSLKKDVKKSCQKINLNGGRFVFKREEFI